RRQRARRQRLVVLQGRPPRLVLRGEPAARTARVDLPQRGLPDRGTVSPSIAPQAAQGLVCRERRAAPPQADPDPARDRKSGLAARRSAPPPRRPGAQRRQVGALRRLLWDRDERARAHLLSGADRTTAPAA